MSESTALAVTDDDLGTIEEIASKCREQLGKVNKPFGAAFALAELTTELDNAITDQMMENVMALQGHPLGFKTDRDGKPNPYPVEVVRPAFIESIVRGFRPINNEWNIIASRFYGCKNGFERLVKTFSGLSNFRESLAESEIKGGIASVPYIATWEMDGELMVYQRTVQTLKDGTPFDNRIVCRLNSGMGHDGAAGKAYRKAYAGIYDILTGHTSPTPEGEVIDAIDVTTRQGGVRQSALFADEPAPTFVDEKGELQQEKLAEYVARLNSCEKKSDVGVIAKAAGSDKSLSLATRKAVMEVCTKKQQQYKKPKADEPPELAESQSLMATSLDDLTRATAHGATAIENRALEARGTGDLSPEHCDIVTAACQKRLQTLDEQKRT